MRRAVGGTLRLKRGAGQKRDPIFRARPRCGKTSRRRCRGHRESRAIRAVACISHNAMARRCHRRLIATFCHDGMERLAAAERRAFAQRRTEIVADHVRSLMANHLSDVASEDRHTVKPWFMGKLDYSPPVNDLASDGFKLVGGRLDYAGEKPVSALVYQRGAHLINVFVWPTREGDEALPQPRWSNENGYHLANWSNGGMTYWAISDVDPTELTRLANLLGAK